MINNKINFLIYSLCFVTMTTTETLIGVNGKQQKRLNNKLMSALECNRKLQRVISWIEKGADIYAKDKYGNTALILLVRGKKDYFQTQASLVKQNKKKITLAEFLIEQGVNVDTKNISGYTALAYAVEDNNLPLICELVCNGADYRDLNLYPFGLMQEIKTYWLNTQKNEPDALCNAVNNHNSVLTKHQWLTFAIKNKHNSQVMYVIHQTLFRPIDIVYDLIYRKHMPVDLVPDLLHMINDDKKTKRLYQDAHEFKNNNVKKAVEHFQFQKKMVNDKTFFDLKLFYAK